MLISGNLSDSFCFQEAAAFAVLHFFVSKLSDYIADAVLPEQGSGIPQCVLPLERRIHSRVWYSAWDVFPRCVFLSL